jgi:hypothetical protein
MDLTEFLSSLRGWTNFLDEEVFTDALLTSFLRMGEEYLSQNLRCNDMLQIDTATVVVDRVTLPPDFQKMDFCRIVGGAELRYKPRAQFYSMENTAGYFTTSGLYLIVGGPPSPTSAKEVELHYFGDVPPLTGAANWVSTRYLNLLTSSAMVWASAKMEDSEQKSQWLNDLITNINSVNENYMTSTGSGSRLSRRIGSFG